MPCKMEDHGAVVKIVSWFLLIVSSGAVAACLLTSWHLLGRKILVLTLLLSTLVSKKPLTFPVCWLQS